jgi:DNA-binding beta-propeller fold protein YncE
MKRTEKWSQVFKGGLALLLVLGFAGQAFGQKKPKFAYVANARGYNVSAYTIDGTTGALTSVPGSPFAAGSDPQSVAVDPSGKFAYVANLLSSNVTLEVQNVPLGVNTFQLKAQGQGANLTGTVNPVTEQLTIGDDGGSTTVTAQFN